MTLRRWKAGSEGYEYQDYLLFEVGVGSDESVINGIDKVCELAERARTQGLYPTDELYPNVINMKRNQNSFADEAF